MGLVVKVGEAKTRLSELLARVEAGEDVTIARGDTPIARLVPTVDRERAKAAAAEIRRRRKDVIGSTTIEEIMEWKNEGRR